MNTPFEMDDEQGHPCLGNLHLFDLGKHMDTNFVEVLKSEVLGLNMHAEVIYVCALETHWESCLVTFFSDIRWILRQGCTWGKRGPYKFLLLPHHSTS